MGHNTKKKKKKSGGGGGRKSKGRALTIDSSHFSDVQDLLSEELTALASIFQEDIEIITESSQIWIGIDIRPYANGGGFEVRHVSAHLVVRFLPGYPHKCPKLQIEAKEGLSKEDANRLHSLLLEQANICAREGRVMVYNLVEAAQEFLSEIALETDNSIIDDSTIIYDSVDLFGALYEHDGTWGAHGTHSNSFILSGKQLESVDKRQINCLSEHSHAFLNINNTVVDDGCYQSTSPEACSLKHCASSQTRMKLEFVKEGSECDSKSLSQDMNQPLALDSSTEDSKNVSEEDLNIDSQLRSSDNYDSEGDLSTSSTFVSATYEDEYMNKKKDLLMVHLLQKACSLNASLMPDLPKLSSELCSLGMLSTWAADLVLKPPTFSKSFSQAFGEHMIASPISQFWKADLPFTIDKPSSFTNSRYLNDFEEVRSLGRGGFGHVVLCKNKLDGRHYAVKKIPLKDKALQVNEKILREVATLSLLQHQHVVRYYQAWIETCHGTLHGDAACGSITTDSLSWTHMDSSLSNAVGPNPKQESVYLYIQMEFCPRTLRKDFDTYNSSLGKEYMWHLFRQILEGLAHIHGQGIIHRDLTPSNIFFDVRNEIKIGDFGLAKFSTLQLPDDQQFPAETTGVSFDGTGQVGTFFYTAPEIEQMWPKINEKVDMYSLGVVFFELWHPFSTAMERHIILTDLKQKGSPPANWIQEFPDQAALLTRLLSPNPADRPSASEVLQHSLPPRMEDEWLNDVLRTIQTAEDTYVYDRVISTIFDEERLVMKSHCSAKMSWDESMYRQYNDVATKLRDSVIEIISEIFRSHGGKKLHTSPLRVLDRHLPIDRNSVKLLNRSGNMLELCQELRSPFVAWIINEQKSSFRRYEISWVHRRAIGCSTPHRFLQGDFDIIGGSSPLTEAETIKVAMDVATRFFHPDAIRIKLNHRKLLEAIWSWVGIDVEKRKSVAQLLPLITSPDIRSSTCEEKWKPVQIQLLQNSNLSMSAFKRLKNAALRFYGPVDQVLARFRGALSPDKFNNKALEELSALQNCLRVWSIDIYVDLLMLPPEDYYKGLYFQIDLLENNSGSNGGATLLALGGCYDHLVHRMCNHEYKLNPPNAVGLSLALERILRHSVADVKNLRNEPNVSILVCSKGGGGLLRERMEVVAELWQANMKAEFVPLLEPSLTEQYEYANERDIKCLVVLTEAKAKVRHLELKKEKVVEREALIKFLSDGVSTQFRNLSIWN